MLALPQGGGSRHHALNQVDGCKTVGKDEGRQGWAGDVLQSVCVLQSLVAPLLTHVTRIDLRAPVTPAGH